MERRKPSRSMSERWSQILHASKWTELSVCFALGLVLSAARIGDSCAPFGTAILAVLGYGSGGLVCLLGASIGYYAAFGFTVGTQMTAGCVLTFAACYFLRNSAFLYTRWAPPVISAVTYGITRLAVTALSGGFTVLICARLLFWLSLCAGAALAFHQALELREVETAAGAACRTVASVVLLSCAAMGISGFVLFGEVSLGRIAAVLSLLVISAMGGALSGGAAGVVLGIAMDLCWGGVLYAVVYPVTALIGGLFGRYRRPLFTLICLTISALTLLALPRTEMTLSAMLECAAAALLYLMLPRGWILTVGAFLQPVQAGRGESGLRHLVAGRLGGMSRAYRALYDVAQEAAGSAENDNDIAKVFDRTSERVCLHCVLREECWIARSGDTLNAMNDASVLMQQRGRLEAMDFPEHFRQRCLSLHEFTEVVNGELRLRAYRRRMKQMMQEERSLLLEQYRDFSDVLADSARALDSVHGADPLAERRLTRYLRTLGIEADAAVFRDERGRLHAALESRYLKQLMETPDFLDGISAVLGVRLCVPERQLKEDSLILLEAEPLSASVGIAAVRKHGETVSGDRGTYFKTDGGQLCVILSDGMGTGAEAADGSINAIRILERFLRAGVAPSAAMKLLNSTALARDESNWGYATVDLMVIDLFTGDACFYKYGAAPSYIKTGNVIRKIKCRSFAAGLKYEAGKTPDVMHMRLKPGSVAVIASDGVVSDGKDVWLRKLLEKTTAEDMKTLAGGVIRSAVREYGRNDDMTALAVKVEVRQ
ncbi:MAG: SpoIIE family protein phosphatase [Oscillospiraceae bacterium]|nr:SpoIIE family protein phosphatase [Oscillospiraceae bacterium]